MQSCVVVPAKEIDGSRVRLASLRMRVAGSWASGAARGVAGLSALARFALLVVGGDSSSKVCTVRSTRP